MLTDQIAASNVSEAWLSILELLARQNNHRYHLVVGIERPTVEVERVKHLLDRLYEADDFSRFKYPVESVASTVFPTHMATRSASPRELAETYRQLYPFLQRFRANQFGTYFGRIVEEPVGGGLDQLNRTIAKLTARMRYKACYELDMSATEDMGIYQDPQDRGGNRCRGFPCLSHISFQLEANRQLHAVAYYRSHDVVSKAYGNYLGLGRLMEYIAANCGAEIGHLTVVAGHAFVSPRLKRDELRNLLEEARKSLAQVKIVS